MSTQSDKGAAGRYTFTVEQGHAITFSGDGMPAVLSTPQLIALIERTARETVAGDLQPDERTVGVEINLRHIAPTPLGQQVSIATRVIRRDGALLTFNVEVRDAHEVIARGLHKRAIIQVDGFSRRVARKQS